MKTTYPPINTNATKAAALAIRLEAVNTTVSASSASKPFIDATLKTGLSYAIFLTELEECISPLSEQQIQQMLKRVEDHCAIYESEFSKLVNGDNENEQQ